MRQASDAIWRPSLIALVRVISHPSGATSREFKSTSLPSIR
jgi:hypothetical protein